MNTNNPTSSSWTAQDRDGTIAALDQAPQMRVLVVGDLMVDQYLLGGVERISPEAPVPILRATTRERRPGGAANVALNLRGLGCHVTLAGIVGHDDAGKHLKVDLEDAGMDTAGIVVLENRPTTLKTRVMSGGQHLIRVDEEVDTDLEDPESERLLNAIKVILSQQTHQAIILEDYDKGALSPAVISGILAEAKSKGIPVSVDPKFRHFQLYKGVALFKPNLKELKEGLGLQWESDDHEARMSGIESGLKQLENDLHPDSILLTLSEHGVRVRHSGQDAQHPAHPREILDVSGAGDTVIAVATVLLAAGVPYSALAAVANLAGGLVCETPGVVPIDAGSLRREIQRLPFS